MKRVINNQNQKEIRRELRRNQTPQEILLWSKIRNNQTGYKWRRQVSIGPYIADFYCREKFLVIEVDGSQHVENKEYDVERNDFFKSFGIRTLRFWNNEVNVSMEGVMIKIMSEIENTTSPQPSPGRRGRNADI